MAGPWEKYADGPWTKYATPTPEPDVGPTADSGFLQNAREGIGRGMASIGRNVGQAVGGVLDAAVPAQLSLSDLITGGKGQTLSGRLGLPNQADIDEANRLDKPLMQTGGGKVGNFVGQAATVAPAMLIPGANTALGASAVGAGVGALTTEGGLQDRAIGAGLGAAGGLAGVGLGKGAGMLADRFKGNALAAQATNAPRDAAVMAAREAGYVLPPTEVKPGIINSALEGLSGKIKTSQAASAKNQPVTNALVKQDLGLPEAAPITKEALGNLRQQAGQVYNELKQVGNFTADAPFTAQVQALKAPIEQFEKQFPQLANKEVGSVLSALEQPQFDSGAMVEALKRLRFNGQANKISMDPAKKELGQVQAQAAKALEELVDRNLTAAGQPDLLKRFQDARTLIAKTHNVEKALNNETGNVSAQVLAKQLQSGKPLSGDLKTVAQVSSAFPKATQALQQNYNALSPLDYMGGMMSAGATGPMGAAATLARPLVRNALLSRPGQALNGMQNYSGNSTLLNLLRDNRLLPAAGMALPANQ